MATEFKKGHKFDLLDLFTITPKEVGEIFLKELKKRTPDMENIQVFLDSGLLDLNETFDEEGYAALHICVIKNHKHLIVPLIEAGADVNLFCRRPSDNGTPLHYTGSYQAKKGRKKIAKILLDNGADLFLENIYSTKPADWARNNYFFSEEESYNTLMIFLEDKMKEHLEKS